MKAIVLSLCAALLLATVGCQKTNVVSMEQYKKAFLSSQLPDGMYYLYTRGRSKWEDFDSNGSFVEPYTYPLGIDVKFDVSSNTFKVRYFIDIGKIIYVEDSESTLPEKVDSLMFAHNFLDPKLIVSRGLVATTMLTDAENMLDSGLSLKQEGTEPIKYTSVNALKNMIDKALDPGMTSNQQKAAFADLRNSTHYTRKGRGRRKSAGAARRGRQSET